MVQQEQKQQADHELLYFDGMGGFCIPIKLRKPNQQQEARDKTAPLARPLFRLRKILNKGRDLVRDNIGYLRNAFH